MSLSFRYLLSTGVFLFSVSPLWAGSVTLPEAIRQGLDHSPRVSQAKTKVDAAEARARQAGVSPNPVLSLQYENFGGTGAYRELRSADTTLAVSQTIELGGKLDARVNLARTERDFAFLSYKATLADLERDIRSAHASLRAAEDRAVLARENVGAAKKLLRSAKVLVEVGRDPPLRELRAQAQLAVVIGEEVSASADLLIAQQLLAALIGNPDPKLTAFVMKEAVPPSLPPDAETLDVKLAVAERSAARARVRLARSGAVPDVTGMAGVRRFGESQDTALIAGISMPIPVRDSNRGNIEAAQADSLSAESGLVLARLKAKSARYEARMLVKAAEMRKQALAGPGISQAEEAVRLARLGYNAGKFSLLELLDAQNALTQAKLNLINARLDRAQALAALIRANVQ